MDLSFIQNHLYEIFYIVISITLIGLIINYSIEINKKETKNKNTYGVLLIILSAILLALIAKVVIDKFILHKNFFNHIQLK